MPEDLIVDRELEARYQGLFDRVPVGIYRTTPDGRILEANAALVEMLGYPSREALLGEDVATRYEDPEDREAWKAQLETEDVVRRDDLRLRHRDGRIIHVQDVARAVRDEEGRILYYEGMLHDVTERRRAERALRESEERYRTLFRRTPIAIIEEDFSGVGAWLEELRERGVEDLRAHLLEHPEEIVRAVGRIRVLDVNPATVALFEADREEQLLGRHRPETMAPESFRSYTEQFVAMWEGRDRVEVELAARTLEGRRLHGKLQWMTPRLEEGMELARSVVAITDITEMKEIEEALRESEERFRNAFENAPMGMALQDPDGRYLQVNATLCEMVGRSEDELLGATWQEITHPEDRGLGFEETEQLVAGEISSFQLEKRYLRPDGETVWAQISVSRLGDGEEAPTVVVQSQDISARHRAEESRERLIAILEATTDFVAVVDWEGRFLYANQAARAFVGLEEGEAIPSTLNVEEIYPPRAYRTLVEEAIPTVLEEGSWSGEMALVAPDGREVPVSQVLVGHRRPDGRVDYFSAIVRDITDRKQAEERLEELVRSKDEFVASVSHELRTPLTAVVGLAQELRDGWDVFEREEAQELVTVVADQAIEVANIVEDLLVAARADIGKVTVNPEAVDVTEQARQALAVFPAEVRDRVEVEGQTAIAWADPSRVRQIVRNLLTNASRYGGPEIRLEVRPGDGVVRVRVGDDGPGIPEADRERVFEPYYRTGPGRGQPASVGLGLTVSRQLARLMGGELTYRYEGGRSVFELTLPAPP